MSFIFKRQNLISSKLKLLIKEFQKLNKNKKIFTFVFAFIFIRTFMKLHFHLKKKNYKLQNYYDIIDKLILETKYYQKINTDFFKNNSNLKKDNKNYKRVTEYYGFLFEDFDDFSYYEEPYNLLTKRLKINNFNLNEFKNKKLIDYGCGNGRYTQVFHKLGCKSILGVDFSKKNISTANLKNKFKKNVKYKVMNVNNNSLQSKSFDYVFCNGVLHHNKSILRGLKEIRRIMKDDGKCIIYLSSTDGIKWYFIEAFREIVKNNKVKYEEILNKMIFYNMKKNKIFYLLDHIFAKYNQLTTRREVENLFKKANLKILKFFNRGHKLDDIERSYQLKRSTTHKIAWSIYGYGEHRYILEKKK